MTRCGFGFGRLLITNDMKLRNVKEIHVPVLEEYAVEPSVNTQHPLPGASHPSSVLRPPSSVLEVQSHV
jgi:hypothetical protein